MDRKYIFWRIIIAVIGFYHIVAGLVLLFSGELALKLVHSFAGMTLTGSPELGIIGEIFGCYLLAFGLMMGIAAWDPIKKRDLLTVGLILFFLRIFQRLFFAQKVMTVFHIPSYKYWTAFVLIAFLGLLVGFFRWIIYRDTYNAPSNTQSG